MNSELISDTPRTDAMLKPFFGRTFFLADEHTAMCELLRTLERELAASRKLAQEAIASLRSYDKSLAEHIEKRQ